MFLISLCAILTFGTLLYASQNQNKVVCKGAGLDGQWKWLTNKQTYLAVVSILVLTSTIRYGFIDTYAYKEMYVLTRNDLEYVNSAPYGVEAGWLYVCYLLNYITASPKIMLFLGALIINGAYLESIKKYSCDPIFSMFIYFCLMFLDTNNGLRQMVAAAITIFSFPLLTRGGIRNFLLYGGLVILAMQFHESAVVCFIIMAVIVGKPLNIKVQAALLLSIVFLINPGLANNYMGDLFSDSKYLHYLDFAGYGMSSLRAFITGIIPAMFAGYYIYRCKKNRIRIGKTEGILLNLIFINTMFVLMGLYMQYWARFAFYTSFAVTVLMPKLIYEAFVYRQTKMMKTFAIIGYFVFFAYNIYVNAGYGALNQFYIDIPFLTGG